MVPSLLTVVLVVMRFPVHVCVWLVSMVKGQG